MNNLIVYCETENGIVADVSLELLTKGSTLANKLGCKLEALVIGSELSVVEKQIFPYGVDTIYVADDKRLAPYTSMPHAAILINLFKEIKPQICLMGATSIGRDLGPRVSSALHSGLTA
ncbi:MAG: electron transfer flavoprotein subunit alpha, partial [Bacteroidales bacterium]